MPVSEMLGFVDHPNQRARSRLPSGRTFQVVNNNDNPKELEEYFTGQSIDIVEALMLENDRGKLAGLIELNVRNFAEGSKSAKVPYIEALFVRPEYRGQGYGKALMRRAEVWALERGFTELASDTELNNVNSIAIHRYLGYTETERVVCFLKRLV